MKTKQRDVKERPDTFYFSSQNYVNLRALFLLRAGNQRASPGQMAAPRQHQGQLHTGVLPLCRGAQVHAPQPFVPLMCAK